MKSHESPIKMPFPVVEWLLPNFSLTGTAPKCQMGQEAEGKIPDGLSELLLGDAYTSSWAPRFERYPPVSSKVVGWKIPCKWRFLWENQL